MRDLYQQILDGGETAIEQLKSDRVQENVELDFKTKTHPSKAGLTKEDRQNLGEALSAFSNSMGGLVIWGVVAKKNDDNIDCVCGLDPIDHIERFKSEVERAVSKVLMPRHDGIQIEMIRRSSAPTSGYLIIKVERSERRPHRSEAPGQSTIALFSPPHPGSAANTIGRALALSIAGPPLPPQFKSCLGLAMTCGPGGTGNCCDQAETVRPASVRVLKSRGGVNDRHT